MLKSTTMEPPQSQSRQASAADIPSGFVKAPLFLVGSERSGTTLLRLMLDHHPKLAFFMFDFAVAGITDDGRYRDLAEYVGYLEGHRSFRDMGLSIDRGLDVPHLINSFLVQKIQQSGKPFAGANAHYHFHRLLRIWPDARFLYILRDGRDVARSIIEMGWAGNMYTGVDLWIQAETEWQDVCRKLPEAQRMEVRYEELVSRPEETLRRICGWIGLPYDPAMLSYHETSTYGPPSTKSIGQWKRKLTPEEVALAESRIGEMLEERGYEASGFPRPEITPSRVKQLLLQDRQYRRQFRRNRYGWLLHTTDALARRLNFGPIRKWTGRKIGEINEQYIK